MTSTTLRAIGWGLAFVAAVLSVAGQDLMQEDQQED